MKNLVSSVVTLGLAVALGANSSHTEKKVAEHVKFAVQKNHTLRPVMQVELVVRQREGGQVDAGVIDCTVLAEQHLVIDDGEESIEVVPVFQCGGRNFVLAGINFVESR